MSTQSNIKKSGRRGSSAAARNPISMARLILVSRFVGKSIAAAIPCFSSFGDGNDATRRAHSI